MGTNKSPQSSRPGPPARILSRMIHEAYQKKGKPDDPPWKIRCGRHGKQLAKRVTRDGSLYSFYYCPMCHLELANKYGKTKDFPEKKGLDRITSNNTRSIQSTCAKRYCYLVKPHWWRDWLRRTPKLLIKNY